LALFARLLQTANFEVNPKITSFPIEIHCIILVTCYRCGALHVGDHVLSVDGVLFDEGLPVAEAMAIVSASSGSQVQLEIVPAALVRTQTEPAAGSVAAAPLAGNTAADLPPSGAALIAVGAVTSPQNAPVVCSECKASRLFLTANYKNLLKSNC
jgi:hypothetical protein